MAVTAEKRAFVLAIPQLVGAVLLALDMPALLAVVLVVCIRFNPSPMVAACIGTIAAKERALPLGIAQLVLAAWNFGGGMSVVASQLILHFANKILTVILQEPITALVFVKSPGHHLRGVVLL